MGNKSSHARGCEPHDDDNESMDGSRCSDHMAEREGHVPTNTPVNDPLGGGPLRPPALHEDVAWAIAMVFYEQLHTRVVLQIDPLTDDFAIVKSYEWIRFHANDQVTGATALAATTTWFWLSCCAGYSGYENPRFWKRVFCELGRPFPLTASEIAEQQAREEFIARHVADRRPPKQGNNSITDAIRFFDHPERPFPRVKIDSNAAIVRHEIFGLTMKQTASGFALQPRDDGIRKWDTKLRTIWRQLEPFIAMGHLQRPIDVMLTGELSRTEIEELAAPPSLSSSAPRPLRVGEGKTVPPRFVLHSLVVNEYGARSVADQKRLLCHDVVKIPSIRLGRYGKESAAEQATRLRAWFCVDKTIGLRGRVHTIAESRKGMAPSDLAAICSLLPHSQSIHTFESTRPKLHPLGNNRVRPLELLDWAWVGYALFHPDAQASKWCNLHFYVGDLTMEAVRVLGLMAKGNHLAYIMEGNNSSNLMTTDPTTAFYHSAQVQEGTRVRAEPSHFSETLLTLHGGFAWVGLCVDDPSTLDHWVRVVAPGVGFGWIKSSAITGTIVSRPPGKSCLQSLRLQLEWDKSRLGPLPGFLSVNSENLTKLELVDGYEMDAATLRPILVGCPALTSLRVNHDGSLWASPAELVEVEQLPSLRHLWLRAHYTPFQAPTASALATCLRDLTEIRVFTPPRGASTQRQVVKLLESHPGLQYLHCSDSGGRQVNRQRANRMDPYVDGRLRTHAFFSELPPRALCGANNPFSPACQRAFWSVIHRKRERLQQQDDDVDSTLPPPSALGRLDEDVACQIFAFASSLVPRDLWLE